MAMKPCRPRAISLKICLARQQRHVPQVLSIDIERIERDIMMGERQRNSSALKRDRPSSSRTTNSPSNMQPSGKLESSASNRLMCFRSWKEFCGEPMGDAPEPVIFELEGPGRMIERLCAHDWENRLHLHYECHCYCSHEASPPILRSSTQGNRFRAGSLSCSTGIFPQLPFDRRATPLLI